SYPKVRTFIRQQFVEAIKEHYPKVEVIAGVATGGIAIGALVAEELGLPFVYVRAAAKGHGLQNMIEGEVPTDKNVVIIEDLISTGGSSLTALKALRDAKSNVLGMVAIFTYGFETAVQNFKDNNCNLITLSDYITLITTAEAGDFITPNNVASLNEWRKNPEKWKK
ncbi:MAG: orotate phosphoribosyltransferase, partial [Bacteroidetes bacterium RIFCSPLOWO2_12_FULL_31_6]